MIATEKFRLIRAFSPPLSEIPRPADTISHKPNCIRRGNLSGFAIFFLTGNVSRETFCTEKFRKTLYKAKKSCYNKIVLVCVKATPHKARLTALHAICVQIFRHIAQKSLARQLRSRQDSAREQRRVALRLIATIQSACGISVQSAEKSDNAPYAQALCGVASNILSIKFGVLGQFVFNTPQERRTRVSIVYAVANQKGGVGKSTTVVNLGAYLGSRGKRVLCVDIDPQGNTTTGLGIKKKQLPVSSYEVLVGKCSIQEAIVRTAFENVSLLPAKNTLAGAELELSAMDNRMNRLKMQILTCKLDYDYILIDCPPALGLLTVNGLVAADQLIIPMLAEFYALEGLSQLTNTIKVVRSNYNPNLDIGGILFVMFDQRLNVSRQVEEEVKKYFPNKVFQTKIPRNVRLSEAPSHGKPVMYYDRFSKGAEAYMLLGLELLGEKPPEKKRRLLSFGKKRESGDQ